MDSEQKQKLATQIEVELTNNAATIKQLEQATKPISPDNAVGRLSRMEAIGNKGINEAALSKARHRQAMLLRALRTIDDDEFGLCYECGEPIPLGRILLLPEAVLCVACATEAEG